MLHAHAPAFLWFKGKSDWVDENTVQGDGLKMLFQLSPGITFGLILGLLFPRYFKYGLFIFMMIPGGGGS